MSRVIRIGRLTNNDICYSSPNVSRMHADLACNDDGSYILTDHSKFGTTVNGRMLNNSSIAVHYGDNILFANAVPLDWSRVNSYTAPSNGGYISGGTGIDYEPVYPPKNNGFAIAGFVCSFFFSVIGIVLSIIGLNKVEECGGKGRGLAIAGIIISVLGIFIEIIYFIFVESLFDTLLYY